jgi:PmbA protein
MREKRARPVLTEMAEGLVTLGKAHGADECEITIVDADEFNVDVRLGKIENLVEAGSRSLNFRVIKDKKTASFTSFDLSRRTLHRLIISAIKRAELSSPDEFSGLPSLPRKDVDITALELYDPEIPALSPRKKISLALQTEKIALSHKGITNSHGASFETKEVRTLLANSNGFFQEYKETFCSLSVGLQAGETDSRVEDFWFCAKRNFHELDTPEDIAQIAVTRTLRLINPRKIRTQPAPVIFEPLMTSWLLGLLFTCVSGTSIYRKASFLVDRLGEKIAGDNVNVYDHGLLPSKLGTRPFDGEGVPSQKTSVIKRGVLSNYLCDTYAARKLKLKSTGNSEGKDVGPTNFYFQAGKLTPEKIMASMDKGLILVRTIGHGLNPITGDISRGAFGLWVEKGEVIYPVSEITISGNLSEILNNIEAVGEDLEFRGPFSGPTVKVGELMIAGE